jgi:UDP-N-acetylmuramoyl-L-alanyl-D-glutamate--2,6-diaminopimelate ligase
MMALDIKNTGITLQDLVDGLADTDFIPDVAVSGISCDSRTATRGDVFIACKGHATNGIEYIENAIKAGVVAVLVDAIDMEKVSETNQIPVVSCNRLQTNIGIIASRFYGHPSSKIFIIGVTGTNGKTSISHFISEAFSNVKKKTGLIGTLGSGVYGELTATLNTTPDPITIQRQLNEFVNAEIGIAVIEASSHGLDQHRLAGVEFGVAVYTNLTEEHLDYHENMESYGKAKRKLFQTPNLQHGVINIDDSFGKELYAEFSDTLNVIPYAIVDTFDNIPDKGVFAKIISSELDHMELLIQSHWGQGTLLCNIGGLFNAYNLLAALSCLCITGIPLESALTQLSRVHGVAGRLQPIKERNSPTVIIDYAHTPDALRSVLNELDSYSPPRLITVFGCGGNRDKNKRASMGDIAAQFSNTVILTSDNPRFEDPDEIIADICEGIKDDAEVLVEVNREQAIKKAIALADFEDVILIAGKGHETYQEIQGKKYPFNDAQLVRNLIGSDS